MGKYIGIGLAVFVGLLIMSTFFGSWYTIDQGQRGVILRNGAITGTADPGLGFKLPFIDTVREISVQAHSRQYENVMTYSNDQQPAGITLSVNYRIPADKVMEVYEKFGGEDGLLTRLLDRQVYEETKTVFGQFNAVKAIQQRAELNAQVMMAIQEAVHGPIIIDSVQIENIDFSEAYEASIEARMLAEVEVQKLRQNAEREKVQAQIAVTQAQGQADSNVAVAKAQAEATKLKAEADAFAIRARGDAEAQAVEAKGKALSENPGLTTLIQAERWDGKLPGMMVPGGTVPFLDVNKLAPNTP